MKRSIDLQLIIVVMILLGIGVIMVYSTSAVYAGEKLGDEYCYLRRQLLWIAIGIIAMLGLMFVPMDTMTGLCKPALLGLIFLLVLVFVPYVGREINNARRWISVGIWSFQPSELARIILPLYAAHFLSEYDAKKGFCRSLLPVVIVVCVVSGLILLQPDYGSAVLLIATVGIMLFFARVKLTHLFLLGASAAPLLVIMALKSAYRLRRISTFLDPWQDPQGAGYQIVQSFLAFGSGGALGKGVGMGMQKLFYLPAVFTDFIFSIVGEEFGIIGTVGIVVLFAYFSFLGFRIAMRSPTKFLGLLAAGVTTAIVLRALVNVGVTTGCLPTKGIPLPFISFGGSSLIADLAGVGILLNVSRAS